MATLSHEQWLCINEIILSIYSSDHLEDLRSVFLHQLEELIPHEKSWFDLGESKDNRIIFYNPFSTNMTDQELNDYYELYQTSDYVPWSFLSNMPIIYRDSDILSDPLREKTYFYKNWLEPMGVYYGLGSTLVEKDVLYGSITVFRSKALGDFSEEEMLLLTILSKHMSSHLSHLYPNGINRTVSPHNENLLMDRYHITLREYQVLELICQGLNNHEISESLFISQNTVKKHVNNLFHKLNVLTRSQMINLVYTNKE